MASSQVLILALKSVQWDIQHPVTLLENSNIVVFSYTLSDGSPAVTKVILYSPDYLREITALPGFIHPCLSLVKKQIWLTLYEQYYWAAELERGGRTLWDEMRDRRQAQHYWSGREIIYNLHALVDALATMQRQGIAHGHIRPHNVFVVDEYLKLGDFGLLMNLQEKTLSMEEVYFQSSAMNVLRAVSDAFKADVYCLGLTFLAMTHLDMKNGEIGALIAQIHYGDPLKEVLRDMLQTDETQRCSYADLNGRLQVIQQAIERPAVPNPAEMEVPRSIQRV